MACVNMFNTEHQTFCPPMSPRISFSNDFILDDHHMIKHERSTAQPSDSSDFEFSVTNYSMITADELFSKGRLLPLKENCTTQFQKMTLRDELMNEDDGDDDVSSSRPPKSPIRWKEFLGLKKNHVLGKKNERIDGSLERIEGRNSEEGRVVTKVSQELRTDGVEIVI
ncbi:uncharacterized protein LOC143848661 [Tasmannia lanceolata]|uniref:uncharacterized protein LOC143848661 n=1 Tax=Tasmannia lanceolata TaxID=3420 RepID=UPI0040632E6F